MTNAMEAQPILERLILNTVQKKAVSCEQWPQLIFAGAGSGKTRVLTAKIAYLIEHCRVSPAHIFAATFTNKAAREMQMRVEELIGIPCDGLWIGTFHSLCARILRREAHRIGYSSSYTIFDADDQIRVTKQAMRELELDEKAMPPKKVHSVISRFKNECTPPDEVDTSSMSYFDREIVRVYERYQELLQRQNAMDFDDLITNVVYLFRGHPKVLEGYRNVFRYILVDEYQDTNGSQFALVKLLGGSHRNVFVVGDDDQSIYGWRGAQVGNILGFEETFPGTRVFKLEQNYRSTKRILQFANSVIRNNSRRVEKSLWTTTDDTTDVVIRRYRDERQEADSVVERIVELMGKGYRSGQIGILFRTNAQSRVFEDVFRRRNVPYVLVGGISFYERKEIKDCLAYLKLLVNPKDNVSCERILNVPARGIGAKSVESLSTEARRTDRSLFETILAGDGRLRTGRAQKGLESFREAFVQVRELYEMGEAADEIMRTILRVTGYIDSLENEDSEESEARINNINELVNALATWSSESDTPRGLEKFLEDVSLATDVDRWKNSDDAVNLMTLHSAKGLEFDVVFVVGLEDGILPSSRDSENEARVEEECRLLYVGATRARKILELSYADQRWRFGYVVPMTPSRFLSTIPETHYRLIDMAGAFTSPVGYSPAATRPERKSGGAATGRVMHARQVRKPNAPRPSSASSRPVKAPGHDDFSQDTVQYRMGQYVSHAKYGRGKILSISGFGPDMRLTVLFGNGIRKKMLAKFANLEAL